MFEQGIEEDKKIEEVKEEPQDAEVKEGYARGAREGVAEAADGSKEPQVKDVADIMKRYLESQQELMEMISTLFIRLNKFKDI